MSVNAASFDTVGNFHLFFYYQDPLNFYRLVLILNSQKHFVIQRSVAGTVENLYYTFPPLRMGAWTMEVTRAGVLHFYIGDTLTESAVIPLTLAAQRRPEEAKSHRAGRGLG
mgnify:CR=1 FL=1